MMDKLIGYGLLITAVLSAVLAFGGFNLYVG
jgi:hypothetical protein